MSAILALLGKLIDFFNNLFARSQSKAADAVVEEANKSNKAAADIALQTEAKADDELAQAQRQGDDDLARVRAADELRDEQRIVQQAIDRANKKSGADRVVRRK